MYTDKKKVERAEQQRQSVTVDTEEPNNQSHSVEPPKKRVSRSQSEVFDVNRCAICQKEKFRNTRGKGTRCRETLTLNMTDCGSASLLKAAQIRDDRRLLLQIQGQDTIAIEIKYHKSCYKEYVRPETLARLEEKNCEKEDLSNDSYSRAFTKVKEFVQDAVLKDARAVKMSELLEKYVYHLSAEGVDAQNYRSSKLKNRLTRCFGNSLSFRQPLDQTQSEIVYSAHVTTGEVVETIMNTEEYGDEEGEDRIEVTPGLIEDDKYLQVYHTAKLIRSLVTDMKPSMAWPPMAEDLDCKNDIVPDLLYNMLAWICSSDSEYSNKRVSGIPPEAHRIVLSLAQDLIHSVSRGRIKTPKHVALPLTVKSLTGNAELITILNRFGHALSYTQIEELETALEEREIEKQQDGMLIPSTCSVAVPGVFCWDNNDLLEETLSGIP